MVQKTPYLKWMLLILRADDYGVIDAIFSASKRIQCARYHIYKQENMVW